MQNPPPYVYNNPGSYTVSLTVSGPGGSDTETKVGYITVYNWAALSAAPIAGREEHTAVWTGTEMIIWGGRTSSGFTNTGARFNPSTGLWTSTSTAGAPSQRFRHCAVWTGSQMIIWGGSAGAGAPLNNGARYNPSSNSWTPMNMMNAPSGRFYFAAVWTGSVMIVFGGATSSGFTNTGGVYNPTSNQ